MVKFAGKSRDFGYEATANYEFTKSTIRQPESENAGKQLIYTPLHQAKAALSLSYQKTSLSYCQAFTGERFTTSDNSQTVDAYNVADLSLTQYFYIKKSRLEIKFRINNIWDKSYVVLPARPMPMRNYSLDVKVSF